MSYDIYVAVETGAGEWMEEYVGNYTYNVGPMFKKALGIRLAELHDVPCLEAIHMLRTAIADMEDNPEEYKEMDPPNGWGDYAGAVKYLNDIKQACARHPKAVVKVR